MLPLKKAFGDMLAHSAVPALTSADDITSISTTASELLLGTVLLLSLQEVVTMALVLLVQHVASQPQKRLTIITLFLMKLLDTDSSL